MTETTIALTVNGEAVPLDQVLAEMDRLRSDYTLYVQQQGGEADEAQLREWSEENLIEQLLLRQEALRRPFKLDKEPVWLARWEAVRADLGEEADVEQAKANFELQARVERLLETLSKEAGKPSQEELQAYYDANPTHFMRPEQVDVTHILKVVDCCHPNDQAVIAIQELKGRLDKGEPFDELLPYSDDFEQTHGELGLFERGSLVPEFEEVVFNLDEGQISNVFPTPFGYHIARLNKRHPEGLVPLHEVRHEIRDHLIMQKQNSHIEAFVDDLKAKATIERP
jgi:parvulin-like peptidyl-prolyl isomerase